MSERSAADSDQPEVPTEYLCEVVEIKESGREADGFHDHKIAKTMDDAVVWLSTYCHGGAEGRYFEYRVTEIEVVG